MVDEKFAKKMARRLTKRREEVIALLDHGDEAHVDKQVKDLGDEALSSSMNKVQSSLDLAEIEELHLIEEALERIARSSYGKCIDCEQLISERRLEYSAYAARCISCQELCEEEKK